MNYELYNQYIRKMIFWRTWESYLVWGIVLLLPLLVWLQAPPPLYLPVYIVLAGGTLLCNDHRVHYRKQARRVFEDSR